MSFVNLESDVLITADRSRAVGVTLDAEGYAIGRAITSGMVRLLEDVFFDEAVARTPSWDALEQRGRLDDHTKLADLSGLERFVNSGSAWSISSTAQPLGPITTEHHNDDGVVALGDNAGWRPAGTLAARTAGAHTLYFAISDMDMQGSISPDHSIDAVPLTTRGSKLQLAEMDGDCGVCGACGVCAICLEVNEAAPIAAGVAVVAASGALRNDRDPAQMRELIADSVEQQLTGAKLEHRVTIDREAQV